MRACLAAMVMLVASTASADPTKRECIDADARGQSERNDGKLLAAKSSLQVCASAACPDAVRDDCAQRIDELEHLIPTLVFEVKDDAGADIAAVRVTMDGQTFSQSLDGTALPVDPGQHTFAFEAAGRAPSSRTFIVREGDRARHERVVLTTLEPPRTTFEPLTTKATPPLTPTRGLGGQRSLAIVTGSVGLAGIAVGSVFGAFATIDWSNAKSCAPGASNPSDCTNRPLAISNQRTADDFATGSNIAFIVGGALLATGIIVFLIAPKAVRVGMSGPIFVGSF